MVIHGVAAFIMARGEKVFIGKRICGSTPQRTSVYTDLDEVGPSHEMFSLTLSSSLVLRPVPFTPVMRGSEFRVKSLYLVLHQLSSKMLQFHGREER